MKIEHIYIVGSGQMGSGVAQVAIQAGFDVTINDVQESLLQKARADIEKRLGKLAEKGKMSGDDKIACLARLHTSLDLRDAGAADLVIEAATEDEGIKRKIFSQLDEMCIQNTILASNTSSISITSIAANTHRAEKVIGMHFFNPVPVMKLLEIIWGHNTSEETLQTVKEVGEKLGKVTVVSKDSPGFIVSRLLRSHAQ